MYLINAPLGKRFEIKYPKNFLDFFFIFSSIGVILGNKFISASFIWLAVSSLILKHVGAEDG